MRVAVLVALAPSLSGCQSVGGYAAYDVVEERYFAVAEPVTDQFGMWCPTATGFGWDWDKPLENKPERKRLRLVDAPMFGGSRQGRVTDETIGWRQYRRGTFYECPEPGKETA